jgi:hypothetical protein
MTNEEVEAMAGALALARTTNSSSKGHQIAISDAALLIGSALKQINPDFNRQRFIEISSYIMPMADAQSQAESIINTIMDGGSVLLARADLVLALE